MAAGLRSVNPRAQVRLIWLDTWFDPARERDAAMTLMNQGADVLAFHTASNAVMVAAQERGKLAVAYLEKGRWSEAAGEFERDCDVLERGLEVEQIERLKDEAVMLAKGQYYSASDIVLTLAARVFATPEDTAFYNAMMMRVIIDAERLRHHNIYQAQLMEASDPSIMTRFGSVIERARHGPASGSVPVNTADETIVATVTATPTGGR